MASTASLKKFILAELRNRGVSAKKDGMASLLTIAKDAGDNVQETLEEVLDAVTKEDLPNGVVDSDILEKVMSTMQGEDSGDAGSNTVIISAFDVPEYRFNVAKRVFEELNGEPERFGNAESKGAVFRQRYLLIEQRLLRHQSFTKPFAVTTAAASEYYQLTRIEALQGGGRGAKIVLGMVGQPSPGKFTLEDLSGTVPIDVSKAEATMGFFTENSIVLAIGKVEDGVFRVSMFGLPPPESKEATNEAIGKHIDFFGEASKTLDTTRLQVMEEQADDVMFIFVSDVHLDRPQVMSKLEMLFQAFEQRTVPTLFVLNGPFTSRPVGQGGESLESYSSYFEDLARLITQHPNVATGGHFVLVPGMGDPGMGNFWPRPPVPACFTQNFATVMPEGSFTFTSNPCRIRYYSQEIVVGRYNFMHEMRRHCILKPSEAETDKMCTHLAKTLLAQAHLCPLPATSRPVLWDHDASLRLYPCPDLLVLADQHEMYTDLVDECQVANPGPFHTDFSFLCYYPSRWRSKEEEVRSTACETSVIDM